MELLEFKAQTGLTKKIDFKVDVTELGESYSQIRVNVDNKTITWEAKSGFLNLASVNILLSKFKNWQGATRFQWYPTPKHTKPVIAVCTSWQSTNLSYRTWVIEATFEQVNVSNCQEYEFNIDISSIPLKLNKAWGFIVSYTRDQLPNFANSNRLPLNDFMSKPGRRNYFPKECGTTEALYLIATAILLMYKRFNNAAMLNYAIAMVEFAITILYKEPIPTNPTAQIWLPHWLYTGRGSAEIKGTTAEPNFLNSGVFNQSVNFINGVSNVVSSNLANVYRVHNGELLWKFVYAPLISGTNYPIAFYIDKYNNKILPDDSAVPNDSQLVPGQIQLNSNYSGVLKVVYAFYTGNFVPNNSPIEAFPMWRATLTGVNKEINHAFDVSFWAHKTYNLLKTYDSAQTNKWDRAIKANIHSTLQAAIVINESYIFKIDTSTLDPSSYIGVQLIEINRSASLTRLPNGWYRIIQSSSSNYGQCELQNFAIYAIWGRQTYWDVNFTCNTSGILYWGVSTSDNPTDTTKTYYCPYYAVANTTYNKQFNNLDFLIWGNRTHWHSTNAEIAIATYQGNGGSSTTNQIMDSVNGRERLVSQLVLAKHSGFAGGVLALLENRPRLPLHIMCKVTGHIIIRIKDSNNNNFKTTIPPQNWQIFTIQASNLVKEGHSADINQNDPILQIEFTTDSNGTVTVWYVGVEGTPLPYNSYVYKHLVANRQNNASIWDIGNCQVMNSVLNDLPYSPAVVPFTANFLGLSRVSWVGSPYVGYQDEHFYYSIGRDDLAQEVVRFKLASQNSYANQSPSGANWVFRQVFNWARWDSASSPPYNVFLDLGADPNTGWEGYQHRAIECTAEYWYKSGNSQAGLVCMRFLKGLYNWLVNRVQNNLPVLPPTDYPAPANGLPLALYHTPHGAALILRTAIYANLAGGDRFITSQIILMMFQYLESQFMNDGVMTGSWSKDQPNFTINGVTYKEYFPFWHAEIIIAYLLLEEKFSQISLPTC